MKLIRRLNIQPHSLCHALKLLLWILSLLQCRRHLNSRFEPPTVSIDLVVNRYSCFAWEAHQLVSSGCGWCLGRMYLEERVYRHLGTSGKVAVESCCTAHPRGIASWGEHRQTNYLKSVPLKASQPRVIFDVTTHSGG